MKKISLKKRWCYFLLTDYEDIQIHTVQKKVFNENHLSLIELLSYVWLLKYGYKIDENIF